MSYDFMQALKEAHKRARSVQQTCDTPEQQTIEVVSIPASNVLPNMQIYQALANISNSLADSYAQIYLDLASPDKVSWSGTVHEIREVHRRILSTLAPDKEVKRQDWFDPKVNKGNPTHRDRAKYILAQRGAGSAETDLVEDHADFVDERVETLVRATYTRASAGAHGDVTETETRRVLRYFEALAHDLLDLP